MLIEAVGYDVVAVRTGGEALARLRGGLACCLLVLDWWLPDMTGGELVERLAADPALADIPAVMCTADARVQAEVEARALPVKAVWVKPVETERLFDLLETHCVRAARPPAATVA
jgi:CheY-like chemotaxis protein